MSKIVPGQLAGTNMLYNEYSFEHFLDSMNRFGIRNIEVYGCSPHFHFYDDPDPLPKLKKQIADSGLKVISMMPEENVYAVNIAAKEPRVRSNTVELYKKFLYAAAELGCPRMLLCPGRPYRNEPFSVGFNYAKESILQLLEYSHEIGVALNYETLRIGESTLTANVEDTARMIEEIDDPMLQVCIDTVPVFQAHEKVEDYFERLGGKITHFHLNDGTPDGHLAWPDGWQDIDEHLNALRKYGYSEYITMETAAGRYRMDADAVYERNIRYIVEHLDEE